ncbi:N-acetylated-alpha-linked acidic dipeptidase 2 [Schistosoma japonicum]|uniref:N-acetylated-alpha-linked acidic dipeptidase 2 n=1 Tax=Schistosoma japonicum TaxID=6182 RepID=A0A4Z2CV16_SCHJA|nr:N-acetylated-alpha-linked acidic dipeptidase 2 [Schistosoma japonicum]
MLTSLIFLHLQDWVLEELQNFKKASQDFEEFVDAMEHSCNSFPSYLNRILVGVAKHFVASDQYEKSSLKNVIYGTTGYKSLYFPHVKSSYGNLEMLYTKRKTDISMSTELSEFKEELSNVTNCLQQVSHWLQNGLIGLSSSTIKGL